MTAPKDARIPCTTETRKLVKAQKRCGQCYDELLQNMVEQYNPEETVTKTLVKDVHQ